MFKDGLKVVILIAGLGLLALILKIFLLPIFLADTVIDSGKGVVQKTLNPDNVIANYEWFKQQYNDYLALKEKISAAEISYNSFKDELPKDRKEWTFEDKNELSRLKSISDGLKYQIKDIVSQYNAKSAMQNRSLFKTKDLPEILI